MGERKWLGEPAIFHVTWNCYNKVHDEAGKKALPYKEPGAIMDKKN